MNSTPSKQETRPTGFSQIWTNLLLMVAVLAIALLALAITHQISLKTLKEEKQNEIQTVLVRDVKKLGNDMYVTSALTSSLSKTWYYEHLRRDRGVLSKENYPVLALLTACIREQVNLQKISEESAVYFPNANAIASRVGAFPVAEAFFRYGVVLPETDAELMMGYLKSNERQILLPLQPVIISGDEYRMLPVIMHPADSELSAVVYFREDVLLSGIGMEVMPQDTCVQIVSNAGEVLMTYPQNLPEELENYITFTAPLTPIQASVTVYVSDAELDAMLKPVTDAGVAVIVLVTVTGLLMSLVFSRISVAPLRKLLSSHASEVDNHSNEIRALSSILNQSKEREQSLRSALIDSMLAKAFSGVVLTGEDERFLQAHALPVGGEYRAVILISAAGDHDASAVLPEALRSSLIWARIDPSQFGMVIPSSEQALESLKALVEEHNRSNRDPGLRCGVSAPFLELEHLPTVIRQARFSCPPEPGLSVFRGQRIQSHIYSRLQHERLYQAIFANDREGAINMLENIGKQLTLASAREIYYNVRFTLRSAAEEMELDMGPFEQEYMPHKQPKENLGILCEMVESIFLQVRQKSEEKTETRHQQILEWLRDNACNPNTCAATVAEQFGIGEKKVYKIIRGLTGVSLNEYLVSLRMKTAGKLLYSTQLSVAEVGRQCGYPADSTFFRVFRTYYGMTPSQYRKNGALSQD